VSGAVATWVTCSIVFGLPTGGTSFFWCSIVAGAGGGYAGGMSGGYFGNKGGEFLYRMNSTK
jgi:hypothetical protein